MVIDFDILIINTLESEEAYKWESSGTDGYTIEPFEKEDVGTEIILKIKENTEEEKYDEYVEEHRLKEVIKKYSDFISYPIKMDVTKSKQDEENEDEYVDYTEEETINSMVPIWRKNKIGRAHV